MAILRLPKIFRSKWLWLIGLPGLILLLFLFWIPGKRLNETRTEGCLYRARYPI